MADGACLPACLPPQNLNINFIPTSPQSMTINCAGWKLTFNRGQIPSSWVYPSSRDSSYTISIVSFHSSTSRRRLASWPVLLSMVIVMPSDTNSDQSRDTGWMNDVNDHKIRPRLHWLLILYLHNLTNCTKYSTHSKINIWGYCWWRWWLSMRITTRINIISSQVAGRYLHTVI